MEVQLLNKAQDLFFQYGLKSVSMDELARLAGISKKTIYQSVANKNELVEKVVDGLIERHTDGIAFVRSSSKNAVQEVIMQAEISFADLAAANAGFFFELEKFFPEAWEKFKQHERAILIPAIKKNLDRGIEEQYYRTDLNKASVAAIRHQQICTALNPGPQFEKRTSSYKLMSDLTAFYLHGITNSRGKTLIQKYLKQNNETEISK